MNRFPRALSIALLLILAACTTHHIEPISRRDRHARADADGLAGTDALAVCL